MMNSMTGFGYAEGEGSGVQMSAEIKSLNTRYLDLIVSLPSSLTVLESRVREHLQKTFVRGRVECSVRFRDIEEQLSVSVDRSAASAWKTALDNLGALIGDDNVTLDMIVRQDGVLKTERKRDMETYWSLLEPLLVSAAVQVQNHRAREGKDLAQDIENQIRNIETSLGHVKARAPEVRAEIEGSMRERFVEILGDEAAESRIMAEVAAWIVKTDINEEVVRLGTHISAFRDEAAIAGAKGKKLDFLAQEMGREINTIGSKSPQADVSREVVNMKDSLEKIREQLRNVE